MAKPLPVGIGSKIRLLRRRQDLTQEEIAEASGLSPGYISQIENGKRDPTVSVLGRIAQALGTSTPVLYLMALSENDVPAERREAYSQLAPAIEDFLLDTIKTMQPQDEPQLEGVR